MDSLEFWQQQASGMCGLQPCSSPIRCSPMR